MENEKQDKPAQYKPAPSPGRPAGTPNKVTTKARETIALIADDMADEFRLWLQQVGRGVKEMDYEKGKETKWLIRPDPAGAAKIYLDALEYHIPKLQRTELAGDPNGAPIVMRLIDDIP